MIQITGLQKVRAGLLALDVSNLEVHGGQVAAVIGPAGSGKALLFDLLLGRQQPSGGQIRLAGLDPVVDKYTLSRQLGVLFAEDMLYRLLSPLDNLIFFARLHGMPRERAEHILSEVGMADQAHTRLEQLTPSLLRRLAFGRSILHHPEILLLFEPYARCDEATQQVLGRLIRAQAAGGHAILIFSAGPESLAGVCDALYPLSHGRLGDVLPSTEITPGYAPFKIPIRLEDKVVFLNPSDILYAEAGDERALIATAGDRFPSQYTLSELEQRLARSGFFRSHRSYLVNLQHIKEVIPYTRSSFTLRLDDAQRTEIPLSKSAAAELKELLGY